MKTLEGHVVYTETREGMYGHFIFCLCYIKEVPNKCSSGLELHCFIHKTFLSHS